RQFGTCARPTTRADQAMALIFRNQRHDLGNFPDLVSQWFGVATCLGFPTPPTRLGLEWDYDLALFGRNQRAFVFGMSRLTARFPFGSLLVPRWFRMGML